MTNVRPPRRPVAAEGAPDNLTARRALAHALFPCRSHLLIGLADSLAGLIVTMVVL